MCNLRIIKIVEVFHNGMYDCKKCPYVKVANCLNQDYKGMFEPGFIGFLGLIGYLIQGVVILVMRELIFERI